MKKNKKTLLDENLRRQAETKLRDPMEAKIIQPVQDDDTLRLFHELQVHQIELEMQNEQLIQSRAEVEAGLKHYNELFDFAPVGYFTLGRDGTILQANLTGSQLLGMERGKLIKRRFGLFVSNEFRLAFTAFLKAVFESHEKSTCEAEILKDGNQQFWAHLEAAIEDDLHETCRMVMVDISERKQAEEAVRNLAAQWQTTFDANSDGICLLDNEHYILRTNQAMRAMFEKSDEEMVGKHCWEIIHGTKEPIPECPVLRMKKSLHRESMELQRNGQWQDVTADPVLDANGKMINTVHIIRDITERKLMSIELQMRRSKLELINEELAQSHIKLGTALCQYNDLYDFAPVGYFTLDCNGQIQQSNLAGAHLLGVEYEKLFRQNFRNFISIDSRAVFNTFFEKLSTNQGKETCELELQKNGEASVWVSIEASCFEGGSESRVVVMNITVRKQAEAVVLQYANELEMRVLERTSELVHANHAKDEFLANMSHELRTPLSGILGYCELLLEGMRGPLNEKQQQAVGVIQTSGQHLLGLINDILDLSKIETGKFEIHPKRFEVNQICESSLNFIKHLTDQKTITVEYSPAPDATTVFADPMRLKQILINLLHNAVKFTPKNGSIKLKVQIEPKEGLIRFSVTDTGIGINSENLSKLFKPFVQIDAKLSRQYEGTGLGLSLTKKLVELHGGHIEAQSEFGKGSCFTFVRPWDQTLHDTPYLLEL